ncbi:MAG: hypothetical protein RMJ16_11535, partial [Thermoguttaceae bacterium]|nr:hypothetical protein [Thermoguttaceae bacterium]
MASLSHLLFALTPRAGQRHHVFLLPKQTPPQVINVIASLVEKVERLLREGKPDPHTSCTIGDDLIVVGTIVNQPTTGRPAFEWLCLYSPALSQLPELTRSRICQFLGEKFPELQSWIEQQEWTNVSGEAVPCALIQRWLAELSEFIPKSLIDLSHESPQLSTSVSPRKRRAIQMAAVLIVVVLAAGLATG